MTRVHAFTDDALADHDAVELARQVAAGEVSAAELALAAAERASRVTELNAVVATYDQPRHAPTGSGALAGVPAYIKDNIALAGLPTQNGSTAYVGAPAKKDGRFTQQLLSTGVTVIGKSRLPEFGFNASTEYMVDEPVHNPWHTDHSVGASSGGSAALVAAGVVPIAHANDGGGSIRIPAACAGLVGLKPTVGRFIDSEDTRTLPINIIGEGVVTRTVRDTAAFFAAAESHQRNPRLPAVGQVIGPAQRRLRVGVLLESPTGAPIDEATTAAVERTASILEKAGHSIEPATVPVGEQFAADFLQYWAMLADLVTTTGRIHLDRSWDTTRADGLTLGLKALHRRSAHRTPAALVRLRQVRRRYAGWLTEYDVVLSPVLAHTAPRLGHLTPAQPFEDLMERLTNYVSFTPLHNVAGAPAISVPAGLSPEGLPVGIHLSAAHGDERTLLELAYLLEAEQPFARIQD
ncbi:amidase [Nocardioides humilatus]|uniref:Amidase n=1 Tax=Nocardioides humilatus TaxID=2607660 RepID=A0A5B1LMU3_9ACTN|nr:amidase [Nocardioides humilatus]KAA1420949.1 amidase [Nocardioides humilatus]